MFMMPTWYKELDSDEKLIAFLRFIGREDLVIKFETEGFLYISEVLEVPIADDWSSICKSDDRIDFYTKEY